MRADAKMPDQCFRTWSRNAAIGGPQILSESNMASPTIGSTVSTSLLASSSPARCELAFRWAALQKTQARFEGRTMLKPEIDLGRYTCRAVIDWLDVRVAAELPLVAIG